MLKRDINVQNYKYVVVVVIFRPTITKPQSWIEMNEMK